MSAAEGGLATVGVRPIGASDLGCVWSEVKRQKLRERADACPPNLQAEIALYIENFREHHQKMLAVNERLHRKILAATMISTLAEGRYTGLGPRKDKEKFISIIENDSGWLHAKSVSVLQLEQTIRKHGVAGLSGGFVQEVHKTWKKVHGKPSVTIDLSGDPVPKDLLPVSPTNAERDLVERAKHSTLLYLYRCKLVHEFREQGHGTEYDKDDSEPIYRHGERVYPAKWILGLVPPIISNVETHYTSNQINPYDAYPFGSPWT
ncbi:MAG: hypothetical protein SFW09_07175 [Hyphomicrobiaceae bacterium]|nr:hypothetical protein [Hyphomicrobiaceae bacterium]